MHYHKIDSGKYRGYYKTTEDAQYYLDGDGVTWETVTVPSGTITDLATIPCFARWLIKPNDKGIAEASIVHDYLVGQFTDRGHITTHLKDGPDVFTDTRLATWSESADIMKEIMERRGAPRWKKNVIYYALVFYGELEDKE